MAKKSFFIFLSLLLTINLAYAKTKNHTGKIVDFKDAGSYTYIKIKNKNNSFWAAIMKVDVKKGEVITLKEQVWMKNFKSKVLNKTFEKILFADIVGKDQNLKNVHGIHGQNVKNKPKPSFNKGLVVAKGQAIKVSIKDLYENKQKYKNKKVQLTAEVIQVSNKVMGNTWVKLKDNNSSVIFRSYNEDEKIKIGETVKVIGTINTDIDFGYGYKYEVLGVNAIFTKL